jgi:uncharacterized protein (TIGR03437 family)
MARIIQSLRQSTRAPLFGRTIFALLILGAPSARGAEPEAYWPTGEWRRSTPRAQGLNAELLASLINRIRQRQIRDLDSLLIVRNGHLVVEEYFNGWGPNDLHTLQSVTKSVTSLLTGVALQQGKLPGVEAKALDYFAEYQPIQNLDARKSALRVQDLLTMRTGMDWSEGIYAGSPLQRMNECACNWLRFVVDWPMREQPGMRFEYNSGGTIMLGGAVQKAAGMRVENFAAEHLFAPLGITRFNWFPGTGNFVVHTGGGLNMRPLDMAKLGYLVLRNGRWDDRQIVSAAWISESMRHWVSYPRTFAGRPVDYGYLWWLFSLDATRAAQGPEFDIYAASGAQDQWIFAVPKYDLIVVFTGNTSATFAQPVSFLYTDILPAITDNPLINVSAASYRADALAAESIATAFGAGLATTTQGEAATTIPLPTALAGTTVRVRDSFGYERLAPLFYVRADQVNYQIPSGTAAGLATITVTSGNGTQSVGVKQINTVAPGLFSLDSSGGGLAAAFALRLRGDGSQSYESVARYDAAQGKFVAVPIELGAETDKVFLILYGTGLRSRSSLSAVSVKIGGSEAQLEFAGAHCCLAGLDQINLLLQRSLIGRGEVEIALNADGLAANTVGVTIK